MTWWKFWEKQISEQNDDTQCPVVQPLPIQPPPSPTPPSLPMQQTIKQQGQLIEELRADLTELQNRYITLENDYYTRQRDSKGSNGTLTLIATLCGIALLVVLYIFFKSQGGLPDFSSLFTH